MSRHFERMKEEAKARRCPVTIAVAAAADGPVLEAVETALKEAIAQFLLIGDLPKIEALIKDAGLTQLGLALLEGTQVQVRNTSDAAEACRLAVADVRAGRAQALMKGLCSTAEIMRAVLDREQGLRQGSVLSHVAVFEHPAFDRLLFLSDAALNIAPDLEAKQAILDNAVHFAHSLGLPCPIVACLAAVEHVNPAMPATLDAAALVKAYKASGATDHVVSGPFALDNALFPESAQHKGITDPAAGHADILLAPQIEAGNLLYKAMSLLSESKSAGIMVGAKVPIIVTSRADQADSKFYSMLLAVQSCPEGGDA